MQPLVPSNIDLRDFAFMPVDVHRLLTSDTWILAGGDERAAFMCLLLASWHQMPAGSLPGNDRMLAYLAMASDWPVVKEQALRGWQLADDGRYYHKVVAEKVMEAWLEKLAQRLSSGSGNSSRWGIEFDANAIEVAMDEARSVLAQLNPSSRSLRKRRTAKKVSRKEIERVGISEGASGTDHNPSTNPNGIPSGQITVPIGIPIGTPASFPMLSQETGTETGTGTEEQKQKNPLTPTGGNSADAEQGGGSSPKSRKPPIPYEEILAAYRERLPNLRQTCTLGDKRQRAIRKAWALLPEKHRMLAVFKAIFAECAADDWLNGTGPYNGQHPNWRPDFDFLIREDQFVKIYENAMTRRRNAQQQAGQMPAAAAA